ncbi:MAG: NAD-dependent epimerase/dehydratase family protein [Thermoanaerobaculia bacterium]
MRIFLTGASGYLGGVLARRLSEEGHEVRALVRAGSRRENLEALGVSLFTGDITDRYSLREGMSGADWVIHSAAFVAMDGDLEAMKAVNVAGSDNVASLAFKLGVGGLLSISSIAAFGGSPDDGSLAAEESPVRQPFPSPYGATKHAGQRAIEEWAKRGLGVATVYPSLIYGPPGKKLGANVLLRNILLGRIPMIVGADRKTSWIHIDDVVTAISGILTGAPAGRSYILAGEVISIGELIGLVCRLGGVRPPGLRLPVGAAQLALKVAGPIYRARGRRPPWSPGEVASLARHWAFDDRRARQQLAWQPRPLAEGLPPTIEYLRSSAA